MFRKAIVYNTTNQVGLLKMSFIKMDPEILQEMEDLLRKELYPVELADQSGKEIYNIWVITEKRRMCRFYIFGGNLEEVVACTLRQHNEYYGTTYTRKDVSVVREKEDDTIQLAKANWRIEHLLKTIKRMEQEIIQTRWNLKEANRRLSQVSPSVLQGASAIAKEVLENVDQLYARRHFISPNEPRVQMSKLDKQTLLESYQVPGKVSISVETEYDPGFPVKSI